DLDDVDRRPWQDVVRVHRHGAPTQTDVEDPRIRRDERKPDRSNACVGQLEAQRLTRVAHALPRAPGAGVQRPRPGGTLGDADTPELADLVEDNARTLREQQRKKDGEEGGGGEPQPPPATAAPGRRCEAVTHGWCPPRARRSPQTPACCSSSTTCAKRSSVFRPPSSAPN